MNSDLGPGISYFWGGDVVLEEIIEGLGSVVKLGLCLRSHNSNAGSDVQRILCSKNWKEGVKIFFLGNQRQVGMSNKNKTKRGLLFVACTTISNALEEKNKSNKWVLEINRKGNFFFLYFLVFNGFQKWIHLCGTRIQGRKNTR